MHYFQMELFWSAGEFVIQELKEISMSMVFAF